MPMPAVPLMTNDFLNLPSPVENNELRSVFNVDKCKLNRLPYGSPVDNRYSIGKPPRMWRVRGSVSDGSSNDFEPRRSIHGYAFIPE